MPAPFGAIREVTAEGVGTESCSGRRNGSDELVGIYGSYTGCRYVSDELLGGSAAMVTAPTAMVTAPPDRAASTTQLVRCRSKWIDSRRMVLSMERHSLLLELRLDESDLSWPRSGTVKWHVRTCRGGFTQRH